MKTILMIGVTVVNLALIFYSIAILKIARKKIVNKTAIFFLSFGLLFDISATICMILGSKNSPFTFHGILGYSSLLAMLIDTLLIWKLFIGSEESPKSLNKNLHVYSLISYSWWIVAYVTGAIIVFSK